MMGGAAWKVICRFAKQRRNGACRSAGSTSTELRAASLVRSGSRILGHSRGCRKARRPTQAENASRAPKRRKSAGAVSRLHAPDEHAVLSRMLRGSHCAHGSRAKKGRCSGRVPLFQWAGGKGPGPSAHRVGDRPVGRSD